MKEPVWHGHLRFGLLDIPVVICPAGLLEEGANPQNADLRTPGPAILQVNQGESLDGSEQPEAGHPEQQIIEVLSFVSQAALAPVSFERPCLLLPQHDSTPLYALLCRDIRRMHKTGIAQFWLGGQPQLVALRPFGPTLMLQAFRSAPTLTDDRDVSPPSLPRLRRHALSVNRYGFSRTADPLR